MRLTSLNRDGLHDAGQDHLVKDNKLRFILFRHSQGPNLGEALESDVAESRHAKELQAGGRTQLSAGSWSRENHSIYSRLTLL